MFRGYDARGIYGSEVTEEKFTALGRAYSKFAKKLVVGMDYRKPNPSLFSAFCNGYAGEISFMGNCPTAAVSFNAREYGMALTASHNPAEYAGAKFIHARHGFFGKELEAMRKEFEKQSAKGAKATNGAKAKNTNSKANVVEARHLLDEYAEDIPEITRGVFDLGGGAACAVKRIFPKTIFSEPDPLFERRAPEPNEEALAELKKKTLKLGEVGFAFDGDADRVMVAAGGRIIIGPVVTAFLCQQNFTRGDKVVLNIEFSQESSQFIQDELRMKVVTCPVGTKHVVTGVLKQGAVMGAEPNGHYYIPRHVPDSDGIYAAALLANSKPKELLDFSKQFKNAIVSEALKATADFKKLEELARATAEEVSTMDGVRAVYAQGIVLVRASQTEPKIRITCEAKSRREAEKLMERAKAMLKKCGLPG